MNMTDMSQQPGIIQEPYDSQENNTSEYIPELDENQGIQDSGYWYVPEPDERSEKNSNNSENNSKDNKNNNNSNENNSNNNENNNNSNENNSGEWNISEAS